MWYVLNFPSYILSLSLEKTSDLFTPVLIHVYMITQIFFFVWNKAMKVKGWVSELSELVL